MKKFYFSMAVLMVAAFAATAQAEEKYVAGGFEASGHVVTGAAYQHQTSNAHPAGQTNSESLSGFGVGGRYAPGLAAVPVGKSEQFLFFVDEAELDLAKSFGDNIRIRTDLEFGRTDGGGFGSPNGFNLEQAYATANIPAGNGIEFLLGRFNVPVGFEAVDVVDNDVFSYSSIFRSGARPVNATGAKLYYSFSDMVDLHFYVTNTLTNDTVKGSADLPSGGLRLGFNWGDEGTESTIGVSAFGGTEQNTKSDLTYAGDVDFNWWATESFALGGEVLFRRDDSAAGGFATKTETMGGLLNLHYAFSDVWDGTLKYAYTKQFDPAGAALALTGFEGSSHEISWGTGYAVADEAWLKFEARFDWVKTAASVKSYDYGAAFGFAYNF